MNDVNYTKIMFGEHAMHVPCQLILQDSGRSQDGRHITAVVGIIVTDGPILSEEAVATDCPHELIIGDMVIRPRGKWASRHFIGSGLTGLVTSDAMFPEGHEKQTLDNGLTVAPGFVKDYPTEIVTGLSEGERK